MSTVSKHILLTNQQDSWIKAQVETGCFDSESEVIQELISERQRQQQESPQLIAAIRLALNKGENSGFIEQSLEDIWQEARSR